MPRLAPSNAVSSCSIWRSRLWHSHFFSFLSRGRSRWGDDVMLNDHFVTIDRQCALVEGVDAWCTLSGQTAESAAARQWLQAIDEPDRDAIARLLTSNSDQRKPHSAEVRLRRADGELRGVAMRFVPSRSSSDGEWLGIVTDIDAEK